MNLSGFLSPCDKSLGQRRAKWDLLHCLNYWNGHRDKFMAQSSFTFSISFQDISNHQPPSRDSGVTLCKNADIEKHATPSVWKRHSRCWHVGLSEPPGTELTFCFFPATRIATADLQAAGAPTFTGAKIPPLLTGYVQITHRPHAHLYAHVHACRGDQCVTQQRRK